MPATRTDVARLAKVSTATVSYVLNNGPRPVATATRQRVLEAMAALRYRPNALARGLSSRHSKVLGLIVPDNSNPFFAELGLYVEEHAFARGYSVILCNTNLDDRRTAAYINLLVENQVDGVIITTSRLTPDQLDTFIERGIPLVLFDAPGPHPGYVAVSVNEREGARLATRHLVNHGYRHIACLAGPASAPDTPGTTALRTQGYRDALDEDGLPYVQSLVTFGSYQAESGYTRTLQLLAAEPRPRAIFAQSDLLAIGALRACSALGLRVPEDLAVVGYDNISLSGLTNPPLTTITQHIDDKARFTVQALLARLAGEKTPESIVLAAELVIRRSCGCGDEHVRAAPAVEHPGAGLARPRDHAIDQCQQAPGAR